MAERVAANINRALHTLFETEADVYLLGEDVLDPYGGAFKITRGLSERYADRVLTTPLSENGIVGVANGLALRGNKVVVEVMFGDFLLLALDQLVNFAAKSVTMFGRSVSLPVLIRCPVGGRRGYGATHSQSVHKFVVGVPDLELWEVSPFVDTDALLTRVFARAAPAILFEDKVLYTRRMFEQGVVDAGWGFENVGDPTWTVVRHCDHPGDAQVVLVGAGGVAHRCLDAAAALHDRGVRAQVMVPTRLHPCDPAPVLDLFRAASRVVVVEEGTPDGSWGGVLAHRLHTQLWDELAAPVMLVNSRSSIIPAATHLEAAVLVGVDDVVAAALTSVGRAARTRRTTEAAPPPGVAAPVAWAATPPATGVPDAAAGTPLVVPRLNSNDDTAVLLEWLVADGATVQAGQPVAVLETSKSAVEIEVPRGGVLTGRAPVGEEYAVGQSIATLVDPAGVQVPALVPVSPVAPVRAGLPVGSPPVRRRMRTVQQAVAAVVSASHASIPPAFAAVGVAVDAALDHLERVEEETGAPVGLGALLIVALAALYPAHRGLFAAVDSEGNAAPTSCADVAVTVDAGTGLFLPVVRSGAAMTLEDVADRLVELQMAALGTELSDHDLDTRGVGMGVSLNLSSGADLIQPLILPGLSCMISIGAVRRALQVGPDDSPQVARVVTLGITHDHRVVNGGPATALLRDLAQLLRDPAGLPPH